MMDYSKFSVLMSVYDKENAEYFDLALKSNLCEQTQKPDEIVLVCDGKLTDELYGVIDKYKALYPEILKVYPLQEHAGLGMALNYGLEKCSYDIVARSDSDDVCVCDRFEKQIHFLSENQNVDILGTWIDEFDTDADVPNAKKEMPCTHEDMVKMSKSRNPINHMTVMFKKSVILNSGSYQELPYHEDYYLWIRAINNGAVFANIGECLVHARVGNGMLVRRGKKVIIKSRYIINKFMFKNKMISGFTMVKNVCGMTTFVLAPMFLKNFAYKHMLRQ